MSILLSLLLIQTPEPAPAPPYAEVVHAAFVEAASRWTAARHRELRAYARGAPVVALELDIAPDGAVVGDRLVLASNDNAVDDLMRRFVLDAEPVPAPDPDTLAANGGATCLVRLALSAVRRKPALTVAVACQHGDQPTFRVAGVNGPVNAARDPSARLMLGWAKQGYGDAAAATRLYREAVNAAPGWDLASRALGLALVEAKKVPQAIPHLNNYVEARKGAPDAYAFAREIERYRKAQEARIAEMNRVRDRLSKADIAYGIKKGYALLEPCLRAARKARKLAVGVETLVLTWRVRKDGSAHTPRLEAPESLVMTDHAECIERTVATWRFPRFSAGSEITASRVPIKVRGCRPAPRVSARADPPPASDPIPDEPTFSRCERAPAEIQGHIRRHNSRIHACIMAERRRVPGAPMPETLPITFVVDSNGPVRSIGVNHRAYRTGPLASCVARALGGSLLPSRGADCPAEFSLDLRRLQPVRR